MPGTDPAAYTNTDSYVERAKLAEKGKFQMIFIADTPVLDVDLGPQTPSYPMDPMLALMAVARETKHIGLVITSGKNEFASFYFQTFKDPKEKREPS